jgi:hypothetical protein
LLTRLLPFQWADHTSFFSVQVRAARHFREANELVIASH